MEISNDIITVIALLGMIVTSFLLYRSVPRDHADKLMDKAQEIAAKTPQTWDDEALKMVRRVYDLLQTSTPPTPPTP